MTVYEMIQQLAKYPPDMDVEVNVVAEDYTVEVNVQDEEGNGESLESETNFDEYVKDFEIEDYRDYPSREYKVRINVALE